MPAFPAESRDFFVGFIQFNPTSGASGGRFRSESLTIRANYQQRVSKIQVRGQFTQVIGQDDNYSEHEAKKRNKGNFSFMRGQYDNHVVDTVKEYR
jgi:hypothetical protein